MARRRNDRHHSAATARDQATPTMKIATLLGLSLACSLPALAQQPSARPFDSLPPPASQSVSDAETEDELGGELVLLQGPGRLKLFEVSNNTKFLYTSNILLDRKSVV